MPIIKVSVHSHTVMIAFKLLVAGSLAPKVTAASKVSKVLNFAQLTQCQYV